MPRRHIQGSYRKKIMVDLDVREFVFFLIVFARLKSLTRFANLNYAIELCVSMSHMTIAHSKSYLTFVPFLFLTPPSNLKKYQRV